MGFTISKIFATTNENEAEQKQQFNEDSKMEILSAEMKILAVPDTEQEQQEQQVDEYDYDGLVPGTWGPEAIKIVCEDGVGRSDTKVN